MENSKDIICPRVAERLEKEKAWASECSVFPSTATKFLVNRSNENFKVDLDDRSCTCRKWDLTGIPCCHAVADMFHYGIIAETYVDDMYKREAYLLSYDLPIPAVESHRYWPKVDLTVIPSLVKVGPGRPRKKRRGDPHEDPKKPGKLSRHGLYMSCSLCKSTEHNKRRCPRKNVTVRETRPIKRPVGRPRNPEPKRRKKSENNPEAAAQPARLGRGGRVIQGGGGSKKGKGGLKKVGKGIGETQGFGILVDETGNTYTNNVGSTSGLRSIVDRFNTTQNSVNI